MPKKKLGYNHYGKVVSAFFCIAWQCDGTIRQILIFPKCCGLGTQIALLSSGPLITTCYEANA
jgi:hypothetical protein